MPVEVRFDANARYGAALVGVLFAGYLNVATDFTAYIQSFSFAGPIGDDSPLVNVVQFVLILGISVASFAIVPSSWPRRIAAVTLAAVVLLAWATFGIQRGAGRIGEADALWAVVLDQGFVTLVVALGGWLIVRGRRPIAFLVLLLALVPPFVLWRMELSEVPTGAEAVVIEGVVAICGIGGAWLAVLLERMPRARDERDARLR